MTIGQKIPSKPKEYTKEELEIKKELSKFKNSYIFINTNFKRKSEPIFVLACCERLRNIVLDKNKLIFKSDDEIFDIISIVIQENYINTKGKAAIWGDIVNYVYHHNDGKTYVFDTNGKKIENIKVFENRASLRLK